MEFLRRALWKIGHLLGGRWRHMAWDAQFASGRWDWLGRRPHDLLEFYGLFCRDGVVVDLGCAQASLFEHLAPFAPRLYVGVDVSREAIETSRQRLSGHPVRLVVSDLENWRERVDADLVIFEDTLYYLRPWNRARLALEHAVECLRPGGAVIVVVDSAHKWKQLCKQLEQHPSHIWSTRRGPRWLGVHGRDHAAVMAKISSVPTKPAR